MLSQMARVARPDDVAPSGGAVERRLLVPPERGSELALDALRLEPGASLDLTLAANKGNRLVPPPRLIRSSIAIGFGLVELQTKPMASQRR